MTCANCSREAFADGLCTSCYAKRRRGTLKGKKQICVVLGCGRQAVMVLAHQDTPVCKEHVCVPTDFVGVGLIICGVCQEPQRTHSLEDFHYVGTPAEQRH